MSETWADLERVEMTEWELVTAAQGGDRHAFGELYAWHVGDIFRFVRRRVADRETAEDLTADTFLLALRSIHTVEYQGKPVGAWLTRIASNRVKDHWKSAAVRRHSQHALDIEMPSDDVGPEHLAVTRDSARRLRGPISKLSRDQQWCVRLLFAEGLTFDEAALAMGRHRNAVKSLRYRAIQKISALMDEETAA